MSNENQNQNENDNQVDERVNVPVNELFGMSVDEWNASQSAWDVRHDQHGLHGMQTVAVRWVALLFLSEA